MPVWIKAGVDWHQGEFKTFFQRVKSILAPAQQRQGQTWWWMAYEQAQLAQVDCTSSIRQRPCCTASGR
ncbi:MAG: hypothetical protein ACOYM4_21875 [Nodosilinea sp.]